MALQLPSGFKEKYGSRNTIYIWKTGGIAQEIDMDRLNKINWNGYNVNPGDLYPLDYDNNGQIDQNDRVVIGSTDPKFYGGFSTDFSWKGDRKSTRLNSSHRCTSRMPSSA